MGSKHMAFISFTERADAEKAKEKCHGMMVEGRDMKVLTFFIHSIPFDK
jgi:hypothetical protein